MKKVKLKLISFKKWAIHTLRLTVSIVLSVAFCFLGWQSNALSATSNSKVVEAAISATASAKAAANLATIAAASASAATDAALKAIASATAATASATTAAVSATNAVATLGAASSAASATVAVTSAQAGQQSPDDKGDWKGDVVLLANDVSQIKGPDATDGKARKKNFFAPDGAIFTVVNDDAEKKELTVKFRNISPSKQTDQIVLDSRVGWFHYNASEIQRQVGDGQVPVNSHDLYFLDKAAVEKMNHYRHGWAFGVLTIPYKYQLSDKSFGSALSVGPYFGFRQADQAGSITYVLSAGLVNNIPVALANNAGTVIRSGFTLATGMIFSIDKGTGIQVGVLVGQDNLGTNTAAPYAYEGKPWVSIAVGYKFF